jgi:hypothetical protein
MIYRILKTGELYHELGADYYQKADPERLARRLAKRIEHLGYTVTVTPKPTAA